MFLLVQIARLIKQPVYENEYEDGCCWDLYYWSIVGACTTGMLLGLVLLKCCSGLYY